MTILRILPFFLLVAACIPHREERWAPVPADAGPVACTALRLAARGFAVDTTQAGVIRASSIGDYWETVVTTVIAPADSSAPVRVTSALYPLNSDRRRSDGINVGKQVEVGRALESCGFDAFARIRPARRPPPAP
jgi:hypothetical protein